VDQLDEIRSKIDIVQLISEYLPLKKSGRNFKALCPFHSEKTPSFIVSPERQIWKCFGCGLGGDIFKFLMEYEKMEFGEALRTLAKRAGVKLAPYRPGPQEEEKEKLYQINHLASEFYHYLLFHPIGKKALDYILGRGIKIESLKLFKIGYAPSFPFSLQKFLAGKKGYNIADLFKTGLVVRQKEKVIDFFRDRLIFPLRDHRGNVVGFSGRIIGAGGEKSGPKYINTPETLVYHKGELLYGLEITKEKIKKENQAVIVEGELDLISSYQIGIENIVAIKGSALTEPQLKLLKRFCESICLALDQDIAGDMASRRGIEIADSYNFLIKVVRIPQGKDPDELARKDPSLLKKAIKEAIPVYDFFIDSAFLRFKGNTPDEKRKIGEEVLPVLAKISDEIIKNYYLKLLARRLEVSEEAVLAQLNKIKEEPVFSRRQFSKREERNKTRREILEEYLFSLSFQKREPEILIKKEIKELIKTPHLIRIIEVLEEFFKKEKGRFKSEDFVKNLPSELLEIFNNFYLRDLKNIDDEAWVKREIERTLLELEKITLKEELKNLSREITLSEGNLEKIEKLNLKFRKIARRLKELEG
jgi:DNA primase